MIGSVPGFRSGDEHTGTEEDYVCTATNVTGSYERPEKLKNVMIRTHFSSSVVRSIVIVAGLTIVGGMLYLGTALLDERAAASIRECGCDVGFVQNAYWVVWQCPCELSDEGLRNAASALGRLAPRRIDLSCSNVGDEGLRIFASHTRIFDLSVANTRVSDAGIRHLMGCRVLPQLKLESESGQVSTT